MTDEKIEPLGDCELDQVKPGRWWILIIVAVVFVLVEPVLVGVDALAEAMPFGGPTFRRMPFPLDTIEGAGGLVWLTVAVALFVWVHLASPKQLDWLDRWFVIISNAAWLTLGLYSVYSPPVVQVFVWDTEEPHMRARFYAAKYAIPLVLGLALLLHSRLKHATDRGMVRFLPAIALFLMVQMVSTVTV